MADPPERPDPPPVDDRSSEGRVIVADDLFRGSREVWIEHGGIRYRLRLTRRNKLILQK
jgi:hemin uptake protein HemP